MMASALKLLATLVTASALVVVRDGSLQHAAAKQAVEVPPPSKS